MIKKQKSHISISSNEITDNSFDKNKKPLISNTNNKIEQYLNKLILISLKHKKFLEKNDYFYSQLKRQNYIKKIKLKLTPFQKYEKFKMISKKIKQNKNKFPISNKIYPNKINTLLTTKNYNLKKNKTHEKDKIYLPNYNSNIKHNKTIKNKNKTNLYINSIDTNSNNNNFYPNLKIQKNKYSYMSYDNTNLTMNINKDNKKNQTFRYKTAYRSTSKRIERDTMSNISKNKSKRSIGIFTSAIRPLRIANLKSRNKKTNVLPVLKNESDKCQIPLICMDDSKFLNEIMSNYYKEKDL